MKILFTLLSIFLTPSLQANELGRLFHTKEQRAKMEREYAQMAESSAGAPKLNGIVQRNDGSKTLWIDGIARNLQENEPVTVKVGQRFQEKKPE